MKQPASDWIVGFDFFFINQGKFLPRIPYIECQMTGVNLQNVLEDRIRGMPLHRRFEAGLGAVFYYLEKNNYQL